MRRIATSLLSLVLSGVGCGGGGGEAGLAPGGPVPQQPPAPAPPAPGPPPPGPAIIVSGQFKDANVTGLTFRSGSQQGQTGTLGEFTCQAESAVAFSVGAVTIGTSECDRIVTPLDFYAGSTLDMAAVLNVVRFLLLLDSDADPGNGIVIDGDVRTLAATWPTIDFAATDFAGAVSVIVAELEAAGHSAVLPDEATARAHLHDTVACSHAGMYWLGFGPRSGYTAGHLVLYPTDVDGIALTGGGEQHSFSATADAITYGETTRFDFQDSGTGHTYSAQFTGTDYIEGRWSGGSGTFFGERATASAHSAARDRFVGYREDFCCGIAVFTIELLDDGHAVATESSMGWWDWPVDRQYQGTLSGNRLSLKRDDDGSTIEATVDLTVEPPTVTIDMASGDPIVAYGCRIG